MDDVEIDKRIREVSQKEFHPIREHNEENPKSKFVPRVQLPFGANPDLPPFGEGVGQTNFHNLFSFNWMSWELTQSTSTSSKLARDVQPFFPIGAYCQSSVSQK